MPEPMYSNENLTGPSVADRGSEAVSQARNKVAEFGSAAADKIDRSRGSAASGLENAASAVHQRADSLPGGPKVANLAHNAADRMNDTADYVRGHDVSSMMADVERLVKRNPGPALLFAGAVGFLVGRSLTRD
jgi:ElaB/YqjD/DUF883 family membrane-anchored ribosome-binding protein